MLETSKPRYRIRDYKWEWKLDRIERINGIVIRDYSFIRRTS